MPDPVDEVRRRMTPLSEIDVQHEIAAACRRRNAEYRSRFRHLSGTIISASRSLLADLRALCGWAVKP